MPPWKPDSQYGPPMIGERTLSEEQIETLQNWAQSGAAPGNPAVTPPPPQFTDKWQLGPPDLILEFPQPYELQAEGNDVYRNFVIPTSLNSPKYVRAIEFLPESQRAIHHAVLQVDSSSTSREKDRLEPGPGYDGMGIGAAAPPEGQLVGWAPGQPAYQSYPGTAWKLDPDSDIVIQLHMLPSGKTEKVAPRIGLYFTDQPPTRSSLVLLMRDYEIDVAPGDSKHLVQERMEIPVDSELIGLYPHAHYIGKDLSAYALFPDESKHWIFRIPDWDFNWQSDFRFEKAMQIPAGSTIHMSYRYDNSANNPRNPNNPPQRVTGGWNSTDEMAELSLQFLPANESDMKALKAAQTKYDIESAGGRSRYSYNLASYFEAQGLLEKAAEYYYASIKDEPDFASAHFKLGQIMENLGQLRRAEDYYRTALALRPELIPANIGLARIHYQNRSDFLAIDLLEKVLKWAPKNREARVYLSRIQLGYSSPERALEILLDGLSFHQTNPHYRLEIGKLQQTLGHLDEAFENYQYAAEHEVATASPGSQKDAQSLKSEALRSSAQILLQKEEAARAEEFLQRAIQLMPFNYMALIDSAKIALDTGDESLCLHRLKQIAALPDKVRPDASFVRQAASSSAWAALIKEADLH